MSVPARLVAELVADLEQMHGEGAIDLDAWPAAGALVDGRRAGAW